MKRLVLFVAFSIFGASALAQTPRPSPPAPSAPPAPAAPAAASAAPAPPAAPKPPAPPPKERQPINVKIDLTISEEGGNLPPVKKSVTAVVGDGYNGYVREQGLSTIGPAERNVRDIVAPLNLDAYPVILENGKIRLTCSIQYTANQRPPQSDNQRITTDIRQNLVLNLENGKSLVISDATDPITDRHVTVEVKATILK